VPYVRFSKVEGNMVLNSKRVPEDMMKKVAETPLVLGYDTVVIKKAEGADLDKFWKDHGFHF